MSRGFKLAYISDLAIELLPAPETCQRDSLLDHLIHKYEIGQKEIEIVSLSVVFHRTISLKIDRGEWIENAETVENEDDWFAPRFAEDDPSEWNGLADLPQLGLEPRPESESESLDTEEEEFDLVCIFFKKKIEYFYFKYKITISGLRP